MGFDKEYNKRRPEVTHVALLMGGWSKERDVSISSGRACTKALEDAGYRVTQVDVTPDISKVLSEMRPDVAFNALHGKWGEDGNVQGILETLKIPYTHSGVLASALAMDKQRSKAVFRDADIPVAQSKVVPIEEAAAAHKMALPYVIKPVAEGSSVGVHVLTHGTNTPPENLLEQRDLYGDMVMLERFVPGLELTCAVLGEVALGVTEIMPVSGF
ncbi:MAG TPA: D-alanine--D-alanine ligase, partial [Rhizobiales bacterium]|nr:D-alanine--D-alanine ligase [Hyphomicrobiales bacterium]